MPGCARRGPARPQSEGIAFRDVIKRHAQAAMVVILNGHKEEGVQNAIGHYEVALCRRLAQS